MKIKMYPLIERIVEEGIAAGWNRWNRSHKHTDTSDEHTITNCIAEYIMNGFDEAFEFDMDDEIGYSRELCGPYCDGKKAGRKDAAKLCKQIAQQRYLAENPAVEIEEKISAEFGV